MDSAERERQRASSKKPGSSTDTRVLAGSKKYYLSIMSAWPIIFLKSMCLKNRCQQISALLQKKNNWTRKKRTKPIFCFSFCFRHVNKAQNKKHEKPHEN